MAEESTVSNKGTIQIQPPKSSLDLTTVFGIVLTFSLITIAIMIGKSDANFFNLPSFLIVILGTITVTSVSFSWSEFSESGSVIGQALFQKKDSAKNKAIQLLNIAVLAKQKGLLGLGAIESELKKDPHLLTSVQLVTDGYNADNVERILAQDLDALMQRHRHSASILRRGSEVAPAMGLIGTLIGLVQMLANLQSPETIGPSMAVALLTTFYGAILGTAVLAPMAAKLERNSNEETLHRRLVMLAMGSIARQENPRQLEMLLNSELPPSERVIYFD